MQIVILQIITVIINVYMANTEKKTNIYLATFLFNFCNLLLYLFNGDMTTAVTCIIITVRSFVYLYKDKLKSNVWPFIFIAMHVVIGLAQIENAWQFLPVITPAITCYYLWFGKTTQTLRLGNILTNSMWGVYNAKVGLFIVLLSRILTVVANIIAFIKNRKTSVPTAIASNIDNQTLIGTAPPRL